VNPGFRNVWRLRRK